MKVLVEFGLKSGSYFTSVLPTADVDGYMDYVRSSISSAQFLEGVTPEGARFIFPTENLDSVFVYNEAQATEQYRRLAEIAARKRAIDKEFQPFEGF